MLKKYLIFAAADIWLKSFGLEFVRLSSWKWSEKLYVALISLDDVFIHFVTGVIESKAF